LELLSEGEGGVLRAFKAVTTNVLGSLKAKKLLGTVEELHNAYKFMERKVKLKIIFFPTPELSPKKLRSCYC
jgi:hypothetical protein